MKQAVVLCAGRGSRLGDLTSDIPKAMLPVRGKPLIEHIVEKLRDGGFVDIVLVVGYKRELIERLFQSLSENRRGLSPFVESWEQKGTVPLSTGGSQEGSRFSPRVRTAVQPQPLGTANALLAAAPLLDERFVVTFGDLWIASADYAGIRSETAAEGSQLVGVNRCDVPRGAAVYAVGRQAMRIVEKPVWTGAPDTCWNASGLYALDRSILRFCETAKKSSRGEYDLADAAQMSIDAGNRFSTYELSQSQIDLGTLDRYTSFASSKPLE